MTKSKCRVIVDIYYSEEGEPIYFVGQAERPDVRCPLTSASGFFVSEDALDEWLEDNKKKIIIELDCRLPE